MIEYERFPFVATEHQRGIDVVRYLLIAAFFLGTIEIIDWIRPDTMMLAGA